MVKHKMICRMNAKNNKWNSHLFHTKIQNGKLSVLSFLSIITVTTEQTEILQTVKKMIFAKTMGSLHISADALPLPRTPPSIVPLLPLLCVLPLLPLALSCLKLGRLGVKTFTDFLD